MSTRSYLLLGLLIVVCLAAITLSSVATSRLSIAPPLERGREPLGFRWIGPFGQIAPFGPHPPGLRGAIAAVASFSFLYLASILALFLLPRRLRLARDELLHGWGKRLRLLGIGLLAGVAAALLAVLGAFAFVASPVSLLLIAGVLLALWGGMVAVALAIGRVISGWARLPVSSPVFDLTVGILIVFTLGRIPLAGWVFVALLGALGLGVVIDSRFGAGGPWSLAEFEASKEMSNE
jgi:hypothetical protein